MHSLSKLNRSHVRVQSVTLPAFSFLLLYSWTEHDSAAVPDYFMGSYVMNWPPGARSRAYSTSM